jgi:hypothetical protein
MFSRIGYFDEQYGQIDCSEIADDPYDSTDDFYSSDDDHNREKNPPPKRSRRSISKQRARAHELLLLAQKRGESTAADIAIYEDKL